MAKVSLLVVLLLTGSAVSGFQPGTARYATTCVHPISVSSTSNVHWRTTCSSSFAHQTPLSKSTRLRSSSIPADGSPSEPSKKGVQVNKSLRAASLLVILDIFFQRLFDALAISFPSSLAGCGILFATFLLAPDGEKYYQTLSPGAALLAKWLPVFFVPSLITLPLAGSVGSISELFKIAIVIIGGFYFTLLSTSYTVVGVRKVFRSKESTSSSSSSSYDSGSISLEVEEEEISNESPPPTSKPFSDKLNNSLRILTAASGIAAVVFQRTIGAGGFANPLTSLFMLGTTLSTFVFGARLPKKFVKIVHPLVTCTALTWAVGFAYVKIIGSTFRSMLKGYRTQSLSLGSAGAGDILIFLLRPAVVSLACQMYDRRKLMRENLAEVGAGVGISAFGGVFGTAAAVRFLQIASPYVRLSLLSRNITSPLAMAIAGILGADASLAVSMVVITGLIGANFGANILDAFGIKDAVARGLGIGAAAHGLGTAAFVNEEDAFPFAAISMALTASAATVIASIPLFRRLILQLALGY